MEGSNDENNLVLLTPEEHYVAHQLLVKIYPNNKKLIYACVNMSSGNQKQKRNNKLYGWLRKQLSIIKRGQTKENNESVAKMAVKLSGRTKETHDYIVKHSKRMKGRTKENNEVVRKMAETLRGRTKETHEYLANIAKKLTGRTKETHEGIKNQSIKMKGRTKENNESVRKMAETLSGRTKETHEGVARQAAKLRCKCSISIENINYISLLRNKGFKFIEIQKILMSNGINISKDYIRKIYYRNIEGYYLKNPPIK